MQGRGGKFLVLCAQCRQPSSSRFPRMICRRYVMELSWYVIATDMSQVMPCRLRCWSGCMLTEASFFAWQHRGAFGYTRGRCSQSIQKQPFILISLHLFTYIVYIYIYVCTWLFVYVCINLFSVQYVQRTTCPWISIAHQRHDIYWKTRLDPFMLQMLQMQLRG